MKKYGKIICGALQVPQNYPCFIVTEEGYPIHNPTDEEYLAAGYLPIEESEPEPDPEEGKTAVATYALNRKKTAIVQSWQLVDAPTEKEPQEDTPQPENPATEANGE